MKSLSRVNRIRGLVAWMLCLGVMVFASAAGAAQVQLQKMDDQVEILELTVGKSHIIESKTAIREVMIGSTDVADFKLLSNRKVLILGKTPGRTNLMFRDNSGRVIGIFDLEVGYDIMGLKHKLHAMMPDEKGIEVRSANSKIVLSGEVSSMLALDKALVLARTFVKSDKDVINLLGVGGSQQVMLQVRIAEVSRDSTRSLGVGLGGGEAGAAATAVSGDVTWTLLTTGGTLLADAFGTLTAGGRDLSATLEAMEERGLGKILAEPTLVALSGSEASFLAGGEFPVIVTQGNTDNYTVEYKEFGVGVKFTPTVLADDRISLKLAAEASDIDAANSTAAAIALTTRRTSTTVELGDGQGLAIAGLLQNNMNNLVDQLPGVGDIPVLGALFRSTGFQRKETELVIIVVPRLVKPVPADSFVLPTDNIIPPSQAEQYLNGQLEGRPPQGVSGNEANGPKGVEGPYGHQL